MKFKDHKKKELELKHQIAKRKRLWARYVMWMTAAAVLFIVVFAGTFIAPIVLALMGIISPEAAGLAFLGAFLSLFAGAFVAYVDDNKSYDRERIYDAEHDLEVHMAIEIEYELPKGI